jgi:predicted MFS family arabinose efflux permease
MNEMTEEEGAENPEKVIQTFMGSVYSLHKEKQPFYKKNRFCQMAYEILKEMTNFSLLRQNAAFTLITLSNFFTFSGLFLPYIYLLQVAEEITQMENPKNLLKVIGILQIPFRLIFGWVADRRFISPLNLNTLCVIIATVPFFFYKEVFSNDEWGQYTFAVAFAIGCGKEMN